MKGDGSVQRGQVVENVHAHPSPHPLGRALQGEYSGALVTPMPKRLRCHLTEGTGDSDGGWQSSPHVPAPPHQRKTPGDSV